MTHASDVVLERDATTVLSRHALDLDLRSLPSAVIAQARTIIADTIGVLCAASVRRAVRTAVDALSLTASGPCTVVGHGRIASAADAAFVNGIGGHDIELDDAHPARLHAAAVIVPAVLAATEASPGTTYGEVLAAVIGAYDVEARISQAMGAGLSGALDRSFHPTSVCGSVAAAICAGRVFHLSLEQMRWCIGLAAGQSSGLLTYSDDPFHMLKSFHTGMASRNGVTAALFARRGYQGPPDVLTGPHEMLSAFGGAEADPARLFDGLGSRFEIMRTSLKRHASCNSTHSAVDAILSLMDEQGLTAADIGQLDVQLPDQVIPRIYGQPLWTHNIQYVVALAAHERRVGPEHFTPEWTTRPDIVRLTQAITVRGSKRLRQRYPAQKGAVVTVRTRSGEHTREVDTPYGSLDKPMTPTQLAHKFRSLAGAVLAPPDAEALWSFITEGDPCGSADPLLAIVAKARPRTQ